MSDLWSVAAASADWRLGVAALATAIAGVMRGFAGFGTALTLAPVYSVLWGPAVGVPSMLLMEALIGSQLLFGAARHVNRRVALPMAAAACLAVPRPAPGCFSSPTRPCSRESWERSFSLSRRCSQAAGAIAGPGRCR
jgi:hypothetical protein